MFLFTVEIPKKLNFGLFSTMQTTEGGRKLGQAMTSTGRAVATTSKAVGG